MVRAQGGNLDEPRPIAAEHVIEAQRSGYVSAIDTEALGQAIIDLGGGRRQVSDSIDHSVGLEMLVKIGDPIQTGEPVVRIYANRFAVSVKERVAHAVTIEEKQMPAPQLIIERVD